MNHHEPKQPFYVNTPLGAGVVLLITDYGFNEHMVWTVALEADGRIRHFQTTDVTLHRNDTWGLNPGNKGPRPPLDLEEVNGRMEKPQS